MGATKDMWLEEIEIVTGDFLSERIDYAEAHSRLRRLGFGPQEATDLLDEAVS